jgi:hypothetical protein
MTISYSYVLIGREYHSELLRSVWDDYTSHLDVDFDSIAKLLECLDSEVGLFECVANDFQVYFSQDE